MRKWRGHLPLNMIRHHHSVTQCHSLRNECYCLVVMVEICRAVKKKMAHWDAPRLMKNDGKIKTPTEYALYECNYYCNKRMYSISATLQY